MPSRQEETPMTKDTLHKRNLMAGGLLLVIALGPLAALTLGSRFADLRVRVQVKTIGGETVPITFGGSELGFGSADVIKPNLVAGNGVVHIVDSLNL
jgi:hypothetical protein